MTTAEKLVKVLTEMKMTCATAESCTGGGVGYPHCSSRIENFSQVRKVP